MSSEALLIRTLWFISNFVAAVFVLKKNVGLLLLTVTVEKNLNQNNSWTLSHIPWGEEALEAVEAWHTIPIV